MKAIQLTQFGLENLEGVEIDQPSPGPGEILLRLHAASINARDYQIAMGQFTPNVDFPLIPLSDGAGEVVSIGEGVSRVQPGDRVTPLFFPKWHAGEALRDERSISSGLEVPGVLREYGVYAEDVVAKVADHLSYAEAACLPCASLTAWTALVPISNVKDGDTVLVQGTGGVALAGLQLAKALGAKVVVISSSDEKLERTRQLGADFCINYRDTPKWGKAAFDFAGHGVDAVIEVGGTGTLENSLAAIRHGGHIAIIGYLGGADLGLTVFPLIIKCANLHGVGVGNRDNYEAMMRVVAKHGIRPVISQRYDFDDAGKALGDISAAAHFGKLVVDIC